MRLGGEFGGECVTVDMREDAVILKTRQGRYRVKVKDHGAIVADRTFKHWNDAQAWEADRKRIAWGAGDLTEGRPALSRWHPDFGEAFKRYPGP